MYDELLLAAGERNRSWVIPHALVYQVRTSLNAHTSTRLAN